jgi:hypothetical protein
MNSMVFIRDAKILIARMETVAAMPAGEDRINNEKQVQQEIDYLFNNMTNPSLPTAWRLVEAARNNKYVVDSKIVHKVNQFV